jgi:hypothetical protein
VLSRCVSFLGHARGDRPHLCSVFRVWCTCRWCQPRSLFRHSSVCSKPIHVRMINSKAVAQLKHTFVNILVGFIDVLTSSGSRPCTHSLVGTLKKMTPGHIKAGSTRFRKHARQHGCLPGNITFISLLSLQTSSQTLKRRSEGIGSVCGSGGLFIMATC